MKSLRPPPVRRCRQALRREQSPEIGDAAILNCTVDDVTAEIATTSLGADSGSVGGRAGEGPKPSIAANQQIQGPARGSTQLERAGANRVALIREGAHRVLRGETSNNSPPFALPPTSPCRSGDRPLWLDVLQSGREIQRDGEQRAPSFAGHQELAVVRVKGDPVEDILLNGAAAVTDRDGCKIENLSHYAGRWIDTDDPVALVDVGE